MSGEEGMRIEEIKEQGEEMNLDTKEEYGPNDPRSCWEVEHLYHLGLLKIGTDPNGKNYIEIKE